MSHYLAILPLLAWLWYILVIVCGLTMHDICHRLATMSKQRRVGKRPTHLVLPTNRDAIVRDQQRRRSSAAQPQTADRPRTYVRQQLREDYR